MKKIFFSCCLLVCLLLLAAPLSLWSQTLDEALLQRLQGKTKLSDILQEADNYLNPRIVRKDNSDRYFRQQKLVHRWGLFMSNRLVADGQITDVSRRNYEAFLQSSNAPVPDAKTLSSFGSWGFIGPTSVNSTDLRLGIGRCDRIAFHPTNANTIYIGTPGGGLWRTTNDGATWTALTNNLPTLGISGIVVDYSNANTIYVLTGDGDSDIGGGFVRNFGYMRSSLGVFKSIDGGATWAPTGVLSANSYNGYRLVQDPDEPATLLAATSAGIYRTTNGGSTWTLVTTAVTYCDIEYDPNGPDRVYASGFNRVIYSTNSGADWTASTFDFSISSAGRIELAVTPHNTAYVYALTGEAASDGVFRGLYRSTNNGVSYTRRCNTPNIMSGNKAGTGDGSQGNYDLALVASPTNAQRVLTGGVNVWSSTDGGTTMSPIMFDGDDRKIHVDIHDMKYSPLNGALYCANDGGLYKSTNNGDTWTKISNGLNVSQIYHMGGVASDESILSIGLQDNGLKSRTSFTSSFNHNGTGDGYAVVIKPDDVTKGYGVINKSVFTLDLNGGLDNGDGLNDQWYPTLALHVTNSNTVFAGTTDVFKSTNGGVSYVNKGATGSWCMATCPSNSSVVYAAGGSNGYANDATNGILRRSGDGGDTWTNIFHASNWDFNKITGIGVSPGNSNRVWITLGGYNDTAKVFRTTNAGSTWTNLTGGLPNVPVNCVAVDANENVYVGTDFGVFYRGNGQSNWTPFYTGMPRVPVTELVINSAAGLIRAATFGRGIYSAALYSTCVTDLTLNGSYGGGDYYEASSTVTSAGNIVGGAGTQVFFKAGSSITLSEGFDIAAGNEFKAYLGQCGNGVPVMRQAKGALTILPPPDALDFVNTGYVEVANVSANGCAVSANLKTDKGALLSVVDEDGTVLFEQQLAAGTKKHHQVFNHGFESGKVYKAVLAIGGTIVHWQEIMR